MPEPGNTNHIVPKLNLVKTAIWKTAQAVSLVPMLLFVLLVLVPHARLFRRRKPNIVWGGTPIINIKYGSKADRLYGYRSDTLVYTQASINKRDDYDYVFDRFFQERVWPRWIRDAFLGIVSPYYLFSRAVWNYDIFRFYFDGGFLTYTMLAPLEPWLLHLAGKKIIVVPYGGDARLESLTRQHPISFCMDCTPEVRTCNEKKIARFVKRLSSQSDIVLGCADLVDTLPCHEGLWHYPIDLAEWQPEPHITFLPFRIVHATNHRKYKGTHFLIDAVAALKADGYPVELVLIEKMKTDEAKEVYRSADIIADQFIGGAYALFAMEGMALGKPVLCYLRDDLYGLHPEWAECPIVNTSPYTIKENILKLITDDNLRVSVGARGPGYVKKWHSLEAVGKADDEMYRELWNG